MPKTKIKPISEHDEFVRVTLHRLCLDFNLPIPLLEWSPGMIHTLGKALNDPPRIRLSTWLNKERAEETLRHELAHLAVNFESKKISQAPHGINWKCWAVKLGAIPKSRASKPPANLFMMPEKYQVLGLICSKCGEKFIRRRVKKNLYHTKCGSNEGKLKFMVKGSYAEIQNWIAIEIR